MTESLDFLPRTLPASWQLITSGADGAAYQRKDGLRVIVSAAMEDDGKRWLHVSTSRRYQLPTWDDLRHVKDLFIGADRKAIQVLPAQSEYVNIHPYCLHLWSCLDGDGLPEFSRDSVKKFGFRSI